ncbi:MAG: glycosyltransferase family 2 protein [Bacteroidota bacterium]
MQKIVSYPQVSIIIPVYNGAKYLPETINSIIDQHYENFEILIINDGSIDNTEEIALEFKSKDSRIRYFKRSNSGTSAARNFGFENSVGEFIVFFDADDLMEPDFLKTRLDVMLENSNIGFCGSYIKQVDEQGVEKQGVAYLKCPGENALEEIVYYKPGFATVPSNIMHRRSALLQISTCFDTDLSSSADRFFLCKLSVITKGYCLPQSNFQYRVHSKSMYNNPLSVKINFLDNELFVKKLLSEKIIPSNMMALFLVKNNYMLFGASFKAGLYRKSFLYGLRYITNKMKYSISFKPYSAL